MPGALTAIGVLQGAIAMGYLVISLFFLKFWWTSRDRLFAIFAISFLFLAVQAPLTMLGANWLEDTTPMYLLRLIAFLFIIVAILDKNLRGT